MPSYKNIVFHNYKKILTGKSIMAYVVILDFSKKSQNKSVLIKNAENAYNKGILSH